MHKLKPLLEPELAGLAAWDPGLELDVEYFRGWTSELGLYEQIQKDLLRDRRYGHTSSGPHRADLRFRLGSAEAAELLSRGQLKLLICALKIAQGHLLEQEQGRRCIYLIDDLPAELDADNRIRVCNLLKERQAQVLLTSIERDTLARELVQSSDAAASKHKLFHVKRGKIEAV
jgi:DNA replication and repair protein RecF